VLPVSIGRAALPHVLSPELPSLHHELSSSHRDVSPSAAGYIDGCAARLFRGLLAAHARQDVFCDIATYELSELLRILGGLEKNAGRAAAAICRMEHVHSFDKNAALASHLPGDRRTYTFGGQRPFRLSILHPSVDGGGRLNRQRGVQGNVRHRKPLLVAVGPDGAIQ
jgi:hypothetical protein